MITFTLIQPHIIEDLGILPQFFNQWDPRPAREQLDQAYAHGGGVSPIDGFTLDWSYSGEKPSLTYPGDPIMHPIAFGYLNNEIIIVYESDVVMIYNILTGEHVITRVD